MTQTRFGPIGWEVVDSHWLPDGTGLVTSAHRYGETEGPQLFYLSYPEGRYRRITSDSNAYSGFDLTADGETIAALRSVKVANVWSVPALGKARPKQLTFNANSDTAVGNFVLTGGDSIAFSATTDHNSHLWTVGTDGQNPRQITSGASDESVVRALPGGELLITQMGEDHTAHIGVTDREGGNPRSLVRGTGEWFQDLSSDGKTLLYVRVDSPRDLWSVPIAGGEPRKIGTSYGYFARVSPDNRMVAYLTVPEVEGASPTTCVVAPIEGGAPIATFTWPQQSHLPKWTPDGKGISFLVSKDTVTSLFIQPLHGGPSRSLTRSDHRRYRGLSLVARWEERRSDEDDRERLQPLERRDGWARPSADHRLRTGKIFAIDVAKDGKTIYFLYGNESNDIVLLKNFR